MPRKTGKYFGDYRISIAMIALVLFGSFMIVSAEMGNAVGDTAYLTNAILKQIVFSILGLAVYLIMVSMKPYRIRKIFFWFGYAFILGLLIACRFFGERNGAYAWIPIGEFATIQPSEFAKVFMIIFSAKLLGKDRGEKNLDDFRIYGIHAFIYFVVIAFVQHDFGSAIVLFVICYCTAMIPDYKQLRKFQNVMTILVIVAVAVALLALSDPVTEFLKKHADNYMVGRFLAAADPFLYQYDNGYHLIMSLVSFANGGIFGLGYSNSIHKYMNFPNPSNDFILPVIVEELGIAGFLFLLLTYGIMLYPIVSTSLKTQITSVKMTLLGIFIYFIVHFILNVGGVSGLIPLTGVPILMISSGGSSLMAAMAALGIAQSELERNKRYVEDHRREV